VEMYVSLVLVDRPKSNHDLQQPIPHFKPG
jgi:hypothetical protein